ncbi:MAG: right-handed parallel beta-helix repeat-containing protein [Thermoplasmata archaeon]|nr:right-handed parallel beta-helix repeat-containing protein [Thermoplasmata archaeon]
MKRKGLAVGIILLFIGTCIISTVAQDTEKPLPASRGNWLYVGGSGSGNYSTIQDAIDNSSNGDTVYVYNGTYYEHVEIDKSITLIGENNNQIIENIILDNLNGIDLHYSNNNFIFKNHISGGDCGIGVDSSSNNQITENTIEGIYNFGIDIYGMFSRNNIISKNHIEHNGFGIQLGWQCYNTIITGNEIIQNTYQAILLIFSSYANITNNTLIGNAWGIHIWDSSNNTIILRNTIQRNWYGIELETNSTIVSQNTIKDNVGYGLLLLGGFNTKIDRNNFINNKIQAFFYGRFNTIWNENYWNRTRFFPKIIFGKLNEDSIFYNVINIDWHPAKKPYDIGV